MTALDPSRLVFIDESGFDTKMTGRCGRAARGVPCLGAVPHGHWRNNTFIAGLRSDRIDAPMLIEGAMDGDAFSAWVEQMLAPTLHPGDIVICDNLSVHENTKARATIEERGAEPRFLPAYSQTSIRSKWYSPRSRRSSEAPQQGVPILSASPSHRP